MTLLSLKARAAAAIRDRLSGYVPGLEPGPG